MGIGHILFGCLHASSILTASLEFQVRDERSVVLLRRRPPLDAGIAVFSSAAALLWCYSSSIARVWLHGRSAKQRRIFSQGTENWRLQCGGVTRLGVTTCLCRPRSCTDDACRFNCCELFGAGFPADALRSAGFGAVDVKHSGCSARAMKVST